MNTDKGYLPVAIYDVKTKSVVFLEDISDLSSRPYIPEAKNSNGFNKEVEEKFYVLENEYQQLVFTNVGGALCEINLPFASKVNKESLVRPIEFDREIVENHPDNAHFPSKPFYTASEKPEGPYVEHIEGKLGGYYPLLRRDLYRKPSSQIGTNRTKILCLKYYFRIS